MYLEGMPECFTSYYEIFEKRLAIGATSQVSRKTLMTSGVGAIQAQIAYRYRVHTTQTSLDASEMNDLIDRQQMAIGLNDRELIEEFNKRLKCQRESNEDIEFNKFEQQELADDGQDVPDDSSTEEQQQRPLSLSRSRASTLSVVQQEQENKTSLLGSLSSLFSFSFSNGSATVESHSTLKEDELEKNILEEEEEGLKSFPILNTLGSWTMAKETNQVLRAIGKLLVAFVSLRIKLDNNNYNIID
jgi:hypothetical protein